MNASLAQSPNDNCYYIFFDNSFDKVKYTSKPKYFYKENGGGDKLSQSASPGCNFDMMMIVT